MEGSIDVRTHKAGDKVYLPTMNSCTFCIKDHMWALEYGRGNFFFLKKKI